jgi:murein DD-endopeptidase MepM/ murein hydrolase activator NlpD
VVTGLAVVATCVGVATAAASGGGTTDAAGSASLQSLASVVPVAPLTGSGSAAAAQAAGGPATGGPTGRTGGPGASAGSGSGDISAFLASRRDDAVAQVSRGDVRSGLQQQAEVQARQRIQALARLADKAEERADELAAARWVLPISRYNLTATFGESSYLWSTVHTGLDFAASEGAPIVSVATGTVTSTKYDGAYGNTTVVTSDDGTEIWYCHLSSQTAQRGEVVAAGDPIGAVGSTGNVTGPHLHLEVRPRGGDPVDPLAEFVAHGIRP